MAACVHSCGNSPRSGPTVTPCLMYREPALLVSCYRVFQVAAPLPGACQLQERLDLGAWIMSSGLGAALCLSPAFFYVGQLSGRLSPSRGSSAIPVEERIFFKKVPVKAPVLALIGPFWVTCPPRVRGQELSLTSTVCTGSSEGGQLGVLKKGTTF